jgi:hypothetical protein
MKINSALSARMILASALRERHNQQAWWYLVDHNESDPNSLAPLLGIDKERLRPFLKEASLIHSQKATPNVSEKSVGASTDKPNSSARFPVPT